MFVTPFSVSVSLRDPLSVYCVELREKLVTFDVRLYSFHRLCLRKLEVFFSGKSAIIGAVRSHGDVRAKGMSSCSLSLTLS